MADGAMRRLAFRAAKHDETNFSLFHFAPRFD
jgi:hypothetical protein